MGSASRPNRRARSSKVSYLDSCSEEDDQKFSIAHEPIPSKASESKDLTRRNLALKRLSRSQERVEALQIQKAIEESLSQGEVNENAGRVSLDGIQDSKEVDDSEEDVPNVTHTEHNQEVPKSVPRENSSQEQGMPIPLNESVHGDDTSPGQAVICKVDSSRQKRVEAMNTNPKDLKVAKEATDVDWSSEDDDNDNDDDDDDNATEDESSDASEDFKRKRKGPVKSQQKSKKAAGMTAKEQKPLTAAGMTAKEQKPLTAPVKKPRSSRGVPEAGAQMTTKKSLPSKGVDIKPLAHARLADCKNGTNKLSSSETSKMHVLTSRENKELGGKGVPFKGYKSAALVDSQKSQRALHSNLDSASCETPGILAFSAQSPTGLHRRVIGLSRRFKPPPLHPYLPRMEG